ncbi:glycosyltransferase family 2 protein [Lignipirellula cremea]|uniref:Glycosyltransferase 2-like domain-containing protein n=1 Tax=Lignipirellula cremea TaxID=2528010 RepID=A0A518E4Q5_9BACT|nr:glycosyltransferase family A protein [Lignipirellula cremea]QDU99080.1 hypothetical protein Pla8534_69910 [Lignipirellula cremea]
MTQLSIIIPAWGSAEALETTLSSVLRHRPPACEVLVIHQGSYDDPYDVCDEVLFVESPGATEVDLLNVGLEIAEAPIVHFLGCGVEVSAGWTDAAMNHFDDDQVGSVATVVLSAKGNRIASAGVALHARGRQPLAQGAAVGARGVGSVTPVGPSMEAGFYRRDCLNWLEGFDEEVGRDLVDIDLALGLQQLGYPCVLETACPVLGAIDSPKPVNAFDEGLGLERLRLRHAPPQGWMQRLSHAFLMASEFCGALPRGKAFSKLRGRWAAARDRSLASDYQERLDEAQAAATSAHLHAFPASTFEWDLRRVA